MIQRFEDAQCSRSKDGVRLAFIGTVFSSGKHEGPTDVEANRDLVITTHKMHLGATVASGWSCTTTVRFLPKAGHEYEVHFMSVKGGCKTTIYLVKTESGQKVLTPEESAVKNEEICFSSNG
jgi:hypothetical protein